MRNFTFLTKEQCYEDDKKLDILEKRGPKAAVTDFAILLGAFLDNNNHIDNDSSLEGRTGWYWTKSNTGAGYALVVNSNSANSFQNVIRRDGGARPALEISSILIKAESVKRARDGILEVEYGYYPQKAVAKDMQGSLEEAYKSGTLSKTKNSYTTDSRKLYDYKRKFLAKQHQEYEYNGKRYVRVEANSSFGGNRFTLSNGEQYKDGDNVWIEVSPVKWLVDEREQVMLAEKIIFAGVQFNHTGGYHTKDFDKTDIKNLLILTLLKI